MTSYVDRSSCETNDSFGILNKITVILKVIYQSIVYFIINYYSLIVAGNFLGNVVVIDSMNHIRGNEDEVEVFFVPDA